MHCHTSGTNFNVFYSLMNSPMDLKEKLKIANEDFVVSLTYYFVLKHLLKCIFFKDFTDKCKELAKQLREIRLCIERIGL